MNAKTYKYLDQSVILEKIIDINSSYKIRSYKQTLEQFKRKQIKLKPLNEVLDHFFNKNRLITSNFKKTINKIEYSTEGRILNVIIREGNSKRNDIIWNRAKLANLYGWFFFVTLKPSKTKKKAKKKPKKSKQAPKKEEILLSSSEVSYADYSFTLEQKSNMRPLYKTREYKFYQNLLTKKKIKQKPIEDVLKAFFSNQERIPDKEKKSIRKIVYYQNSKVIVVKSLIGDHMYENLENLVKEFGWYFYITGVPVGESDISIAIDNIPRRFDESDFNNISVVGEVDETGDIPMFLYPISLKPNFNCILLGIGPINILLDCGIHEEDFKFLKFFLQNRDLILSSRGEEVEDSNESPAGVSVEDLDKELQKNDEPEVIRNPSEESELEKRDEENVIADIQDTINLKEEEDLDSLTKETSFTIEKYIIDRFEADYKIDLIFLSHSHYDHVSGLKTLINLFPDVPILCSRITLDLYLLRDSNFLKQQDHSIVEEEDYRKIVENVIYVENGTKLEFKEKNCFLSFFHAGHMPGALMLLVKNKDFRFLFTGDYTYWDITPFAGTRRFLEQISRPIDFLLIDGTSAYEEYGDPSQQFHSLILFLEQKAEYGDSALIGADPSSLAISFMLRFWRYFRKLQLKQNYKNRPNIYVDAMVRKNIQVINHRYEYIYGPISKLIRDKANPFNSIKFRWFDLTDLDFLKKRNNIIISHPPDLSYGIIRNIISRIAPNPHNLIFLAGSIHEKPGVSIIEGSSEIVFSETWKIPLRALLINTFTPNIKIKLHADKVQLFEMVNTLEPKRVCFFHQSRTKLLEVTNELIEKGIDNISISQERRLTRLT